MPKELNTDEMNELESWLSEHGIGMYKIHRELSDGVAVAALIKKYYPKVVEMHSYPSRLNTQLKITNWHTLNKNVLAKLGIVRTPPTLDKLAKGTPGAIESLLYDIMQLEEIARERREKELKEFQESSKVVMVQLCKKVDGEMHPVNEKMIRYSIYEEVVKESEKKDKALKVAEQKIKELEELLKLKEEVLSK